MPVKTGAFPLDRTRVIFNDQGVVWFIYRDQRYKEGGRPTRDAVFFAIKEKYGEPNFKNTNDLINGSASWHFGPLGKAPCTGMDSRGYGTPPSKFKEHCGVYVQAYWSFLNKEKMVEHLEVTVHESSVVYDDLKKKQYASNAAQKSSLEKEQSKNIKPKL